MTSFLLGLSLLFHILTILGAVYLYRRGVFSRDGALIGSEDGSSLEHSLEAFLEDIEHNNEALYGRITEAIEEQEKRFEERLSALEGRKGDTALQHGTEVTNPVKSKRQKVASETAASMEAAATTEERNAAEIVHADAGSAFAQVLAEAQTKSDEAQENTTDVGTVSVTGKRANTGNTSKAGGGRSEKYKIAAALLKQGSTSAEIARELHCSKGEVELMINLIKKSDKFGGA